MTAKLNGIVVGRKVANLKDGKLLSTVYVNSRTKMKWRCDKGHVWFAVLDSVKNKNKWCQKCAKIQNGIKNKLQNGLKIAHQIAKERNGKCLSVEYINIKTKMLWECEFGHKWESALDNIKSKNYWCSECSVTKKLDGLKIAHQIAKERNGKCLSVEYINIDKKLRWECGKKHRWYSTLNSIKNQNYWCPECGRLQSAKNSNNSFIISHWKTGVELICVASYEKAVIEYLNTNRINFRWQPKTFTTNILTKTGKLSTYRPDLYLYSIKKWIEIKGYFRNNSKAKWDWFQTIKPNSELWNKKELEKMDII